MIDAAIEELANMYKSAELHSHMDFPLHVGPTEVNAWHARLVLEEVFDVLQCWDHESLLMTEEDILDFAETNRLEEVEIEGLMETFLEA
ncbi:hypothetical protein RsoM2USA_34 [Ralstonia phage RsoM2USA]|nr:hypothetical protein RsoM2USA_34 [Ralstonia phage RsoM2USA]